MDHNIEMHSGSRKSDDAPRDIQRESLHSLLVVLASATVMIGISWAAMSALTAEDGWLHQATEAAAAEINYQAMSAFND